ncbi:NUDIX hydrolase [Tessaracoccus antarcticus]|uniref:NUDIX domain-containing protein n=1 Tax=Tessaracoccus antarcticus TaxID=2479848 RepID=A0A3M0GCM4_9ACTN|nr:NUDIX domain-containing protein [Tessaracoccus antarcticus]RMB62257.1 NUDIX domain-containing protein [Tessaracoccus antarcticus]
MPTPDFITELRRHVGHSPLWLVGTAAAILRAGDGGPEVLLVRRSDTGEWSLVSGIVDPGEHPADTIVREAMEEAGVVIEVERMLWLVVDAPITYPNGDQCQYLNHGFLARCTSGEAHVGDEESSEVGWFPVGSLPTPQRHDLEKMVAIAADPPGDLLFALE